MLPQETHETDKTETQEDEQGPTPATQEIEDRYELLYLLDEAAELEHGVCCSYLFAAWSLKASPDEGLTPEQAATVAEWKKTITHVAVQEMMHLALVTNLLTALGGAPHFDRPNFPQRSLYAPEIQLALTPFNERTMERFLYIERPDGMDIAQLARDFDVRGPRIPAAVGPLIPPRALPASSRRRPATGRGPGPASPTVHPTPRWATGRPRARSGCPAPTYRRG